jgi:SET domain-containing protein
MMLVCTSLRPSGIHGLGCFAEERIEKGQVVWIFDERIDRRIPVSDLPSLPEAVQEFLEIYAYAEIYEGEKVLVLCGDHGKYMNHADKPNLLDDSVRNIAARDIEPGEELTCNYYLFDLDVGTKLK